jgi:acetyltransferase family protein
MERTTLTSRRLVLSPPTEEDVDTITELCQDPAIQKWTTVPAPYTRESAESFIEDVVVPSWEETSPTWAIRFSQDGPLIGTIALTGKDGTAELGFWLSAAHRGAGLVSEAAARVIDFGFQEMGLASILWRCEIVDGEPNWPSARVAWKCGFTFEGRVRRMIANKGEAHDALVASILPEDSREPKGPWFGPDRRHPAFADPRDPEALVRQFHETYGLPLVADGPEADRERIHMRMALVAEEFGELVGAVYGERARGIVDGAFARAADADERVRDTVGVADALGDIVYVVYGMALELGIPLAEVLAEIQASNLSKLGSDGKPVYREDGKVLKGPDYFPPDIPKALGL